MIKIENIVVEGFETAIRGMRNPKDSWDRSDSYYDKAINAFIMGPKDLELATKLAKGGPVHSKYKRFITVSMDITAPLYWWKEFDTYKVGTVSNSCSTMHKITAYPFSDEMFSIEHLTDENKKIFDILIDVLNKEREYCDKKKIREDIINNCKNISERDLNSKVDEIYKKHWWQLIQMLPSSFNQRRTVLLNYEVLTNIYHSRYNHKQDEWRNFCREIMKLPYADSLI